MTGLETILNQITGDAEKAAAEQLEQARAKAEEILSAAREEGTRQAQAVISAGEAEAADIRERAHSAAQLDRRNQMLLFKQHLIGEVVDNARTALENAPEQEYFSTLLQLAVRFAQPGSAQMCLNQKDLSRLPKDFESSLAAAIPACKIAVSATPADIESGFLLLYGGIDINCTFRAIFEDASDRLRDAVGAILFPEA